MKKVVDSLAALELPWKKSFAQMKKTTHKSKVKNMRWKKGKYFFLEIQQKMKCLKVQQNEKKSSNLRKSHC